MLILAHDYETTGVNTATCGVVQAAVCFVNLRQDGSFEVLEQDVQLLNPGHPIPAGASNVHGIYDADVADMPNYQEYLSTQFELVSETNIGAVLGYNSISFDDKIARRCGMGEYPAIDLMVGTKRFKTQGLLEKATLGASYAVLTGKEAVGAHDAMADVLMTLALIQPSMEKAEKATLSEFITWLRTPWASRQMTMQFGKHKGVKLCNLPRSYVSWALENLDLNDDMKAGLLLVR
jgi:DNA polymerase-3 subunit epsilon